MLKDDPRFQAIFAQVKKLWSAASDGNQEAIDREQAILQTLLEERNKPHE